MLSKEVTPGYLKRIDCATFPIALVVLTHSALAGNDWSVDRMNNDGGYAAGNLMVMSKSEQGKALQKLSRGSQPRRNYSRLNRGAAQYRMGPNGMCDGRGFKFESLGSGPWPSSHPHSRELACTAFFRLPADATRREHQFIFAKCVGPITQPHTPYWSKNTCRYA